MLIAIMMTFDRPKKTVIIDRLRQNNVWWIWIGGIFGAAFVFGNSFLVPLLGTGMTVAIVLVGQIVGSLMIDEFGWLGAKKKPINLLQVVGILIMIGGVFVIKLV